jgi:hypothetical protein
MQHRGRTDASNGLASGNGVTNFSTECHQRIGGHLAIIDDNSIMLNEQRVRLLSLAVVERIEIDDLSVRAGDDLVSFRGKQIDSDMMPMRLAKKHRPSRPTVFPVVVW